MGALNPPRTSVLVLSAKWGLWTKGKSGPQWQSYRGHWALDVSKRGQGLAFLPFLPLPHSHLLSPLVYPLSSPSLLPPLLFSAALMTDGPGHCHQSEIDFSRLYDRQVLQLQGKLQEAGDGQGKAWSGKRAQARMRGHRTLALSAGTLAQRQSYV